jgi:PIN domain
MTLVLDSGGLSRLASDRSMLHAVRRRGLWPPVIPSIVLTESLTGDARRDFHANHVIARSIVRPVDEGLARRAAALRTATGPAKHVSSADAIVVAIAEALDDPTVLTSDWKDIAALVAGAARPIRIEHS